MIGVLKLKPTTKLLAVFRLLTDTHVFDIKSGIAEVGYCFGSKYWGHGYATEALRAVIEYLLNEAGMYLVEARYISGNPASGRVMQ